MDIIISEANMLVGVLSQSKQKDIMTNIVLKDDLYEVVDVKSKFIVAKLVIYVAKTKISPKSFNLLQLIIVTTPIKLKEKKTTLSYLPTNVSNLREYKCKHRKILEVLLFLVFDMIKSAIKDLNNLLDM